jgi:hypothetical protein
MSPEDTLGQFMYFKYLTPILAFPLTGGRNCCNTKIPVPSPLRGRVRVGVKGDNIQ